MDRSRFASYSFVCVPNFVQVLLLCLSGLIFHDVIVCVPYLMACFDKDTLQQIGLVLIIMWPQEHQKTEGWLLRTLKRGSKGRESRMGA